MPAAFGTSGNTLRQSITNVDTVLGTKETLTQTAYVVTGFGPVCVTLNDLTEAYYDFNNDRPPPYTPADGRSANNFS